MTSDGTSLGPSLGQNSGSSLVKVSVLSKEFFNERARVCHSTGLTVIPSLGSS
jgi:hypothetical protein